MFVLTNATLIRDASKSRNALMVTSTLEDVESGAMSSAERIDASTIGRKHEFSDSQNTSKAQ
jgi:hypothetical protein